MNPGILYAFAAFVLWGALPRLLQDTAPDPRARNARAPHGVVARVRGRRARRAPPLALAWAHAARAPPARALRGERRAALGQLGHLYLGRQCRAHRRGEPRLLHQSAHQRAVRLCVPARAPACAAVGGRGAGRRGRRVAHLAERRAALDQPRA
ncbi:hypothetical protein NECAME_19342, partial [Necator americanus]